MKGIIQILCLAACTAPLLGVSQQPLRWDDLTAVTFKDVYREDLGTVYPEASFDRSLQKLAGKRVQIPGYLLPLAVGGDDYALSSSPFAACFFCGKAGPETVIELHFSKTESWFAMDRFLLVEGRLRLNADDPSALYYVLEEAVAVERLDR